MLRFPAVARPREFDHDQVVSAAAELFLHSGYEGTSMRDLIARTGLSSSSIYAAFGGKRGLYLAALKHAATDERTQVAAAIEGPGGVVGGLRVLYAHLIDRLLSGADKSISLSARAALETSEDDPDVMAHLKVHVDDLVGLLSTRLSEAQAGGELRLRQDPRDLALFLLLSAFNLTYAYKLTQDKDSLTAFGDAALSALQSA